MNTSNMNGTGDQWAAKVSVLFMGACLMIGSALTAAETDATKSGDEKKLVLEKNADASADEFNNWVDLSVGGAFVNGDKAQFMRRQQIPTGAFGGVSDFHLEQRVGTNGTLKIDGRGIFDNHDYLLKVELADPNKGYVRAGYREFRTWYDGSGGYYPKNKQWFDLYNDELHIDRGEAWIEGGLTLPSWPEISFKFTHQFRDGKKDSTIWGDTSLTGLPGTTTNTRGIVPTFLDIDEDRNIFQADIKHTIGKTDLGLGFRADFVDNTDSRNIHRRPGEVPPLVPAPGTDRYVTQKDEFSSDMYNVHAFSETRFSDKVLFTLGYSFTTMDTDIGGTRIYGPDYDPLYDPTFARRQARDEGFTNLSGGLELKQHVANLNLMYEPVQNFVLVPSLRFEKQDRDGVADFTQTSFDTARNATSEDLMNHNERGYLDVTESLEARYTGIRNWTFYTRGEWVEGDGDLKETQGQSEPENIAPRITRKTDDSRFTQKYVVGANWYPLQRLNLAGQYYYKTRANDYDHGLDSNFYNPPASTGDLYPAFIRNLDFQTHDMNFRVSWHPLSSLTLVSRYDFQLSTVDMRGDTNNTGVELSKIQSAEMYSHIFSESISWNPLSRLFLQASINYVIDRTETPANDLTGGATKLVLKSKNDYWNASVTAGYALDDKTDLQATYIYYRADDYRDNSSYSQPYGAGAEEHGVTASLSRQMTKNVRWTLRYGFFSNRDELAGGHNNYDAHVVSTTVQYRF